MVWRNLATLWQTLATSWQNGNPDRKGSCAVADSRLAQGMSKPPPPPPPSAAPTAPSAPAVMSSNVPAFNRGMAVVTPKVEGTVLRLCLLASTAVLVVVILIRARGGDVPRPLTFSLISLIGCQIVAYLVWIRRMHDNATQLLGGPMNPGRNMAVFGHFIPAVNFFVLIMVFNGLHKPVAGMGKKSVALPLFIAAVGTVFVMGIVIRMLRVMGGEGMAEGVALVSLGAIVTANLMLIPLSLQLAKWYGERADQLMAAD